MGRGARPACHPRSLRIARSKAADGVVLVRTLQDLAPHLEVEESDSELAQEATSEERGIGSCDMPLPLSRLL